MVEKIKRLPDAELEIMLVIWKAETPVNSSYILDQLQDKRRWGLATLMTVLARLSEKRFLICKKQGRHNLYYAAIGENEYKESEGKSILEKLYGNSFKSLVTSLYNGKAISKNDLAELRDFLDRVEREGVK